jgi:hypothetical protein
MHKLPTEILVFRIDPSSGIGEDYEDDNLSNQPDNDDGGNSND